MISQLLIWLDRDASKLIRNKIENFARQWSIDMVDRPIPSNKKQAVFEFVDNKLVLHLLLEGTAAELAFDLSDGAVGFRAARVNKANEVVSKAIGCKPYYRPKILDATAGMGRDSLIMALLGCEVVMQERNFAIYQLLQNALDRFKQDPKLSEVSQRITLLQQNSLHSLDSFHDIDVIYLDPMFPQRKKSALVKKEMRLFKLLAGEDPDADQLLENALLSSAKRVVVKRPKGSPVLASKKPSHEILAKKFRYDIYLLR